jgi:hypothetical protein
VTGSGDKPRPGDAGRRRRGRGSGQAHDLPRRLGDIITPALDRLAGGDEARAYSAWARAVGEPVTGGTRPRAFRRGQLTVECASSVWANELTYLGPQILRRMDEVAPGHPVKRFRFVVGRLPAPAEDVRSDEGATPAEDAGWQPPRQGSGSPAEKEKRRREQPAADAQGEARAQAEGVDDERLRAAIEAALRRSSQEPPEVPDRGTPAS